MPAPLVKSLAKKYHKSPKTVDKKFKKLKHGIVDSGKGGYGLVVSQLKKGLEESLTPYKRLFESSESIKWTSDDAEEIAMNAIDARDEAGEDGPVSIEEIKYAIQAMLPGSKEDLSNVENVEELIDKAHKIALENEI